ncbi:sigma-54 dependent transcriptional regulator [Roseobacter sp. YSTF-M11]|uniref:Sigma-54 dependent transcriptional regulator n=1 Tax=Roseobacter insulae TaxID=2859783 RepID=A0A9X1FWH5_9RHOB|nr:sigma-54 dependent transcriptional regulator [Roseobacter insulae]MBW4708602.1 sigma-54 dependent transcriptional regulator [Roseobacter insulae]
MSRKVLLVDDDAAVRDAVSQTLELADLEPVTANSFVAAKDFITPEFDGVILSDLRMPGRDGFHLLSFTRSQDEDLPVILLTGEGDIPTAMKAVGQGAFDFLEKPCAPADLLAVLERALKTRGLVLDNRRLRTLIATGDPAARMLFGASQLAEGLRARVRRVAVTDTEVLVTGAPGTGISKVAEVIHLCSPRSKAPFVKRAAAGLDAGALNAALAAGRTGSLFIDEITQMPAQAQLVLMEALETGAETRIIAGSNRDLAACVEAGQLNSELYYRLEVTPVRIPPLSERPEDIPTLFRHYVAQASEQAGLSAPDITPQVVAGLMARDWPGNARALMSEAMRFSLGLAEDVAPDTALGLAEQMAQVEQSLLEQALRRAEGKATVAAQALKLPRKTFYDKLARYGIRAENYRLE